MTDEDRETLLREQFRRVNVDYDTFDFSRYRWFFLHEWTEAEQESYIDWVGEYFRKNKLGYCYGNSKSQIKYARHEASKFVCLGYGWKTK